MVRFILCFIFLINVVHLAYAEEDTEKKEKSSEEVVSEEVVSEEAVSEEVVSEEVVSENSKDPSQKDESLRIKIKSFLIPYKYDPSGQARDPFDPPGQLSEITFITPEDERLHPIEKDDLENIQLRAIISGQHENVIPRALFETSDKKTYTLTKNDRLGREGALIFRIEADRVWLMKPFADPGTGIVGYEPEEKILGYTPKQKKGSLYYER